MTIRHETPWNDQPPMTLLDLLGIILLIGTLITSAVLTLAGLWSAP